MTADAAPRAIVNTGRLVDQRLARLVRAQALAVLCLVGVTLWAAIAGPASARTLMASVAIVFMTAQTGLFLAGAATVWGGAPDPDNPRRRVLLAIALLLVGTAGLVLGFMLLYWTFGYLPGVNGFYGSVNTLTAVNPPLITATGENIQVAQELTDLLFLSGVVTVVLGLVVSRLSTRPGS